MAIEHGVYKRTTAFAELAHGGGLRLAQIGARTGFAKTGWRSTWHGSNNAAPTGRPTG